MKVGIVGAGQVGSTVAYACLLRGSANELVLYDLDTDRADAQALDLAQGVQFAQMASVTSCPEPGGLAGSDVVVIAGGASHILGGTRLDLAEANTAMCRSIVGELASGSPDAVFLAVSNPVDVVTWAALDCGVDPARVLGTGTVLDSARLRFALAGRCGVAVQNVHAHVVGEHGDSEVALWSNATIGGVPLDHWGPTLGGPPDDEERARMLARVRDAGYRIIAGKGATNFAIGTVSARVIEAIVRDERRVLPVSSFLHGWLGFDDVCMSVPSVVGRAGVEEHLAVPMSDAERADLEASAQVIRDTYARTRG